MQQQFGYNLSHVEVVQFHGTPENTIKSIRRKYSLGDEVSVEEIFWRACRNMYGSFSATNRAHEDYSVFMCTRELPDYVARAMDPDVDWNMSR